MHRAKEMLDKWLRGRIAVMRGAHCLVYLLDMSRSLRSVRHALHPARRFLQRFPKRLLVFATAALLSFCVPVLAERADRDKPVHIEADTVRMDDLQKVAVYEGRVILTQGTLRVQADRIEVRQDAEGFLTGTALGKPVHFRQRLDGRGDWVDAWANRVEYDARRQQVRLIGEAFLKKGEEELRGDVITYDARSELYQASGGLPGQKPGRVRAVIMPSKDNVAERARQEAKDDASGMHPSPADKARP